MSGFVRFFPLAAAAIFTLQTASAFETKNRPQFSTETSFASVAWAGTTEQDLDRNKLNVVGSCETLAKDKRHYFLINHRDPGKEGTVGYFLVEIILFKNSEAAGSVEYVKLYRNPSWFDRSKEFRIVLDRSQDIDGLYALHAEPNGLAKVPANYQEWHAKSQQSSRSSFDQSGFRVRADTSQPAHPQRQNYLLIKAIVTSKKRSEAIPAFDFQASDADSGMIRISAPEFALEPVQYKLSFGTPCP
jgi:hypothetical protein